MVNLPNLEASGAKEIATALSVISGGRVLDVCTGKGAFIGTLMKALKDFAEFIGVDIDQQDLAAGREAFPNQSVQFIEMDANRLDFKDASFDTVSIANSLHHLEDASWVLTEMKRVLKPGGYFILEEMYQDGEQTEAQQTDIMEHHWIAKIDRIHGMTHNETLVRSDVVAHLKDLRLTKLDVLDSSRYLKCLDCDDRFQCEDPKSTSIVEPFIKGIDKNLQTLEPHKRTSELVAEAEQLKIRAKETGVANASIVFAIGIK